MTARGARRTAACLLGVVAAGWLLLQAGCSVVVADAGASARPVYVADFRDSPLEQGWAPLDRFYRRLERPRLAATSLGWDPDGVLAIGAGDRWEGPMFPVEPETWYEVRLLSRTGAPLRPGSRAGLWWFTSYRAAKDPVAADHVDQIPYSDLLQSNRFVVHSRRHARLARIRLTPGTRGDGYRIARIEVRPIDRAAAKRRVLARDVEGPPLRFSPPDDRWRNLPRTRRLLEQGRSMRIVLLGDSIANDLTNSHFHFLVEDALPGRQRIELIPVVHGGAGSDWWRQAARSAKAVAPLEPDLVMLGGVSERRLESIAVVVRQLRESTDAEIVLWTGPVWRSAFFLAPGQRRGESDEAYAERLAEQVTARADLASELGVGFWDLRGVWLDYLHRARRPLTWYTRDNWHSNWRAKTVLAAMMRDWLDPRLPRDAGAADANEADESPADTVGAGIVDDPSMDSPPPVETEP